MRKTTTKLALLFPLALLYGCANSGPLSESFFAFDTAFEIRVYDGNKQQLAYQTVVKAIEHKRKISL